MSSQKLKHLLFRIAIFPQKILGYIFFLHHKNKLKNIDLQQPQDHKLYLYSQLKRTLPKKAAPLQQRTKILVEKTEKFVNLSTSDVLCIGCRNSEEINYFCEKGSKSAIGIDLFSENHDILVMDMHHMTFPDNSFDVIYSSHSLEHSHDVPIVISEIVRITRPGGIVAIEVPVTYQTRGADLIDFKNLKTLKQTFEPNIEQVLWSDHQLPYSPTNESGTAIIRAIFQLAKDI